MTEFQYTAASQQVIFGAGTLSRLGEAVRGFGWNRVMVVSIPRLDRIGMAARIEELLGGRFAVSYYEVQPHVPADQVETATRLADQNGVDAVLGLGGGSPIGMAKAVSLALESRRPDREPQAGYPADQGLVPVIAVPTTYSGSEMTPIYGVTHPDGETTRKVTVTDPRATPRLTLYDPELTLSLPPEMTASSGINALAHCIEAVYSISRNPLSSAAALQGIRHITASLAGAVKNGADLEVRTRLFLGAYLAAFSVSTASIGLHHGLCHVLGGSAGVPHGIANSIMLPHAMAFNADHTAAELAEIARAMGLVGRGDIELAGKASRAVFDLVNRIRLPQRLRDVGVPETDLPRLAQLAMKSKAVQNNPKPIRSAEELEAVYRAAW